MTGSKNSKMLNLINYRLRVIMADSRILTGQMLAFDKHMNLVLADCEEFRKIKPKGDKKDGEQQEREEKRSLGLVILRGETIVSLSIEGPPPPNVDDQRNKAGQLPMGAGIGRPAGRGMPVAPPMGAPMSGLAGPVRGVGGPAPGMMAPRPGIPGIQAGPVAYGRPMTGPPPGSMPPQFGRPPFPGGPPGAGPPPPNFRPPLGGMMPPGRPGAPPSMPPQGYPPQFAGRSGPLPPQQFQRPPPGARPPQ